MPFDNFYKSKDNRKHLLGKSIGGVVATIIGYCLVAIILPAPKPAEPAPVSLTFDSVRNRTTIDSEAVQRLNELCAGLPQPEKFDFKGSDTPSTLNNFSVVTYRYSSKRSPDEIMPVFLVWLDENGWERASNADSTFKKGKQSIYIGSTPTSATTNFDYDIMCSEKK